MKLAGNGYFFWINENSKGNEVFETHIQKKKYINSKGNEI